MELHPARKVGESFADYRERRAVENETVKTHLYGPKVAAVDLLGKFIMVRRKPLSTAPSRRTHPRIGKDAVKMHKRAGINAKLAAQPHSMR